MSATVSATLSALTWLISIGVTQRAATFSAALERAAMPDGPFEDIAVHGALLAVTDPAAPAPMMRTLSKAKLPLTMMGASMGWTGRDHGQKVCSGAQLVSKRAQLGQNPANFNSSRAFAASQDQKTF